MGSAGSNLITTRNAPVIARVTQRGAAVLATVRTPAGHQTYAITAGTRVLGRSGRFLDRLALQPGDVLLRQGDLVQDESAEAATVSGQLAQVLPGRRLVLHVLTTLPASAALHIAHPERRTGVVAVLLLPSTRIALPHGEALGDLAQGQPVQATGTLNWRTHTLLRPTLVVVGAGAPSPRSTPAR